MADPSPIQQLQQRQKALADVRKQAEALPGAEHHPKARKDALLKQIDDESKVVNDELALRQQYRDSTTASVNDPDPGPRDPAKRNAWMAREQKRAEERIATKKKLEDLKKKNPSLYPNGDVADPCVKCRAASVAAEIKWMNKLAKVEILDGFDTPGGDGKTDPILTGKGLQWVNLATYRTTYERDALPDWLKKIDGQPVNSFDRLSRTVRIRVEFTQPGVENFKIRLVAGSKNTAYPATERVNAAYKLDHGDAQDKPVWVAGVTDADGKQVLTVTVRAAGGDRWHVEGTDDYATKCKSSGRLATVRGLFLCTVTMDGVAAVSTSDARAEMARQKIHMEVKELVPGPSGKVAFRRFLYCDPARKPAQKTLFENAVKAAVRDGTFKGVKPAVLEPYLAVAHFYDMSPSPGDFSHKWVTGLSDSAASNYPLQYPLWDPSDATIPWFVSAKAMHAVGGMWVELLPAPTAANFAKVGTDSAGYFALKFTPPAGYAGKGPIAVQVKTKIIDGGINGFSAGDQGNGNFVAICRRSSYKARASGEMNQTIVHEIGHKVNGTFGPEGASVPVNPLAQYGAANSATFRWLDASPTHYIGRGHNGGHCYKDAVDNAGAKATALQADFSVYDGHCVMFGSGGAGSKRKINFCPNCSARMRKLDLETGWVKQ